MRYSSFNIIQLSPMGDRKKNRDIWKADRKVQKTTQRKKAAVRHKKAVAK